MKKVTILHGTGNTPDGNWFPWLRRELKTRGYEVFIPKLPDAATPNRHKYDMFLRDSGWDFTDNIVIGHSSGSTTILNLLQQDWFPRIKTAVFVGFFVNNDLIENNPPDWYKPGQFKDLFPTEGFDFNKVIQKSDQRFVIHSDNDPYCDPQLAIDTAKRIDAKIRIIPGGKHLSKNSGGYTELPELIDFLDANQAL